METPGQKCARLVAALEDLIAQEAVCVSVRDFDSVLQIQQKADPLVTELVNLAGQVTDARVRERIAAIVDRRAKTTEWLAQELERTRAQLAELQAKGRRVAQVAPVYGHSVQPRSRLRAIG